MVNAAAATEDPSLCEAEGLCALACDTIVCEGLVEAVFACEVCADVQADVVGCPECTVEIHDDYVGVFCE